MRVGVPKEIKPNEHRIGLTPTAVREYVAHGHEVLIETGRRRRAPASPTRSTQRPAPRSFRTRTRSSTRPR